eukprot:g7925.t1
MTCATPLTTAVAKVLTSASMIMTAAMTVVGIESDCAQVEFCKQRVRQFYEPVKQRGRKKKADQEEEEEEEVEEEEDVDPGEVDKELQEKGSVGASSESSSVSSCFTCKGEGLTPHNYFNREKEEEGCVE